MHAENLCRELRQRGHEVELIEIPFKWYPADRIMDGILACRLLDLESSCGVKVDRVIGLKFPAYHVRHPHSVMWILHPHRAAYEMWGTEQCDLANHAGGALVRQGILNAEAALLGPVARAGRLFTTSRNNRVRIREGIGLDAPELYHPPPLAAELLASSRSRESQPFLLLPSRVNRLKRQLEVVRAMVKCPKLTLALVGSEEDAGYCAQIRDEARRLGVADRVHWHGWVSDERLVQLFAKCRAVVYPPFDEDYGYVTLQAMLAGKPVVTCADSGGVLEFAEHLHTAIVAESAAPEPLGDAMRLSGDPSLAVDLGSAGQAAYLKANIGWDYVVSTLLAA